LQQLTIHKVTAKSQNRSVMHKYALTPKCKQKTDTDIMYNKYSGSLFATH